MMDAAALLVPGAPVHAGIGRLEAYDIIAGSRGFPLHEVWQVTRVVAEFKSQLQFFVDRHDSDIAVFVRLYVMDEYILRLQVLRGIHPVIFRLMAFGVTVSRRHFLRRNVQPCAFIEERVADVYVV